MVISPSWRQGGITGRRVLSEALGCEHFMQDGENGAECARGNPSYSFDEAFAINRAQLIYDYEP